MIYQDQCNRGTWTFELFERKGGAQIDLKAVHIELNILAMGEMKWKHAVLPLFGYNKGEGNVSRCHLMRISLETESLDFDCSSFRNDC